MNIGIDIRVLGKGRAISRYTYNILLSLLGCEAGLKFYLFTDDESKVLPLSLPPESYEIVKTGPKVTLKDHFLMNRLIRQHPLNVFFHPDNTEFLFCHSNSVVVIHDSIPWIFPDLVLSSNLLLNLRQRIYLRLQKEAIIKSSKKIITVSNTSKADLIKILGVENEKVAVTYEGVEDSYRPVTDRRTLQDVTRRYNLPENYIFYLGGFDERKNLLRLIHAFSKVVEDKKIFLVIGGKTDEDDSDGKSSFLPLKEEINHLGLSSLVIFTGFISELDLPAVYSLSRLFVYPSIYEGFGRPPLEAMACGVPVLASNSSSLPEICGDAALLVSPYETKDFYSAIEILLKDTDLRQKYIQKGLMRSKMFGWDATARRTLSVFKSL